MYIKDIKYPDSQEPENESVAKSFIETGSEKQVRDAINSIIDNEFDRLEEYATDHISYVAADRAERFIKRVLAGDSDAAKQLFYVGNSGRYREIGFDKGKPWASLIHGEVFETDAIELRRKLVEAHKDLLVNERIKDLQSIIDGLKDQVIRLENQIENMARNY